MNDTLDVTKLTTNIMQAVGKVFKKVQTKVSEETGLLEITNIDVGSLTNRVMMAIDVVMRKFKIHTFQGNTYYDTRPMVEGIMAVVLVDRKVPNVDATKPAVLMVVTTIMADFAAALAVNESMEKRA